MTLAFCRNHRVASSLSVSVGQVVSFSYPTVNRFRVPTRIRRRRLVIDSIRDLEREPLDPLTTSLRPDLRRGRYLLNGFDLDLHEHRSFYLDSARTLKPIAGPLFRFAVYDPLTEGKPSPLYWVGTVFTNDPSDRAFAWQMLTTFHAWSDLCPKVHLAMGLFPYSPSGVPDVNPCPRPT